MHQGFIKIWRKFLKWEWYADSDMKAVFLHLVLTANYKDTKWRGLKIKRGQVVTGRKKLSKDLKISEQTIRTCLSRLKSTNEITIKSTNRFSIITICNYKTFQVLQQLGQPTDQPAERPTTSKQPKPHFSCEYFKVLPAYHAELQKDYPLLDMDRIYLNLKEYIDDQPDRYKRKPTGELSSTKNILRNWCDREKPRGKSNNGNYKSKKLNQSLDEWRSANGS